MKRQLFRRGSLMIPLKGTVLFFSKSVKNKFYGTSYVT